MSTHRKIVRLLGIVIAVSGLAWGSFARAATYTWDSDGTFSNGATDGTGSWNTSASWYLSTNSTDVAWTNLSTDSAQFGSGSGGSTAYTVTLAQATTANGLIFQNQAYTLTGSTLTLAGTTPTITVNASGGTVGAILAGATGLAKAGTGVLTLTAANTYTGGTTIGAGTVQFQGASALPGGSAITLGSATLQIQNDGSASGGTISLGNNITLSAASTTDAINVANNGSGNTGNTVALGTLNNGTSAAAFTSTFNFTGANGYLQSYSGLGLSGLAGAATTLKPTTTSVIIAGNVTNQESGTVTGHYDTLDLDGTSAGNVISGVISDAAGFVSVGNGDTRLTKSNTSTWSLTGANTFSGPTTISGGTLVIGGAGVLGGGSYSDTIANSAVLIFNSTSNQTLGGVISGTGTLFQLGNSLLSLTAANTYSGATTISGGTLAIGNGGAGSLGTGGSYSAAVSNSGALTFNTTSNQTLSGAITGTGTLTQAGPGMLTLSNAGNTYSGATNVSGGTLYVSGATSLPNSTLSVSAATLSTADGTARTTTFGGLNLGGGANLVMDFGDQLTTAATATSSGAVTLVLSGSSSVSGTPVTLLQAAGGLANATYSLLTANNTNYTGTLSVVGTSVSITPTTATPLSTAYWYGGQVTGAPASMSVSNGAASNWSNGSSYTATGLVPGSTANVNFSTNSGASQESNVVLGANMTLNSVTFSDTTPVTINADGNTLTLTGTGTGTASAISANQNATINANLALGAAQTWTAASGATLTVGGPVSGAFALTTAGAGTVVLTGANTYTGTTTINGGALTISGSAASNGNGGLVVGSAGNGSLNLTSSGTVDFYTTVNIGNNGFAGAINQSAGTFNAIDGSGSAYLKVGASGYGYYNLSGGALNVTTTCGILVGDASGALGIVNQSGGQISLSRYLSVGSSSGATGIYTMTGGTTTVSSSYYTEIGDAGSVTGVLNIGTEAGGNAVLVSQNASGVTLADGNANSSTVGILNLNSGTVQLASGVIQHSGSSGTGTVNFNGGTVAAGTALTLVSSNLTAANVFAGGAIFDMTASSGTVAAKLLATAGSGVYTSGGTLAVPSNGGSGYIGAPLVTVTTASGSGSGAMAVATVSGGVVIGVTLTDPGQNYTVGSQVVFAFSTSGSSSPATAYTCTLTSADLAANVGGVTKSGAGTLYLTGANTYTGGTTVAGGTLEIPTTASLPGFATANVSVASGGVLAVAVSGTGWTSGNIDSLLGNGNTTFQSGSALGIDTTAGNFSYGTAITNPNLGLVLFGGNTLTLTGSSTFTGNTTISAGTLAISGSGSLGSGGTYNGAIVNSGALVYSSSSNQTLGGIISGAGSLTKAGSSTLSLSGANSYTGATAVSGGTLVISGVTTGSDNGNVSGGYQLSTSTLNVATGALASISLAGTNFASGNGGTALTGAGTLQVSGGTWWLGNGGSGTTVAMSAGGLINVQNGEMKNDYSNANWTGNLASLNIASGASFDLRNNNVTVDALTGGGALFDNGYTNALTVGVAGGSGTYSGTIGTGGATVNLVKSGAGTETLTGVNTYTGTTTINAGTLAIGNGGAGSLGTGGTYSAAIANSGALVFNTTVNQTLSGALTGSGNLAQMGSSVLTLTNAGNTYSGSTTISGGTLAIGGGGTYSTAIANSGVLVANTASNPVLSGAITGGGSLTQAGPGMLTLSNAGNTYSGATNVSGGTLYLSGATSLPNSTLSVTAAALSTADGTARTTTLGGLTLGGGANLVMDWGDQLQTAATATAAGNVTLTPNGSFTTGTPYTFIAAGGGLAGANYFLSNTNYTATMAVSTGSVTVTPTGAATPLSSAYWYGGQVGAAPASMALSNGAVSNWSTGQTYAATGLVPGSGANVNFSTTTGASQENNVVLGANMVLNSVTFSDTTPVTINADGYTLTLMGTATSVGINATQNATIGANLALGAAQTWTIASGVTLTVNGPVSGAYALTEAGNGTLALNGTLSASTPLAVGTASTLSGSGTLAGNVTLTGNGAINFASGGLIAGTLGVTGGSWNGAGSVTGLLTASGAGNVFSVGGNGNLAANGNVSITGGTMQLVGAGVLGGGSYANTIANAGALVINTRSNQTLAGVISGAGTLTQLGPGLTTLTAVDTYTGATTVGGGTLQLNTANGTTGELASPTVTVNSGGVLALNAADVLGFTASREALVINDGAVLNVTAASRVTIKNTINMTGGTLGGASTGDAYGVYSMDGANVNATSDASGNPAVINAMTFSPQSGTLTFNVTRGPATPAADLVIASSIINYGSSTNGIALSGNGILSLTGTSTFTGTTTINSGTFEIGGAGVLSSTATSGTYIAAIANSGALVYNSSANQTFGGVLSGSGTLAQFGPGLLTLSAADTFTGGITIGGGTLQIGGAGDLGSGSYNAAIANSGALVFNTSTNQTFSGAISGSGTLYQLGSNTTTLTGTNAFTGGTTVGGGVLEVLTTATLPGTVYVANGATLAVTVGTAGSGLWNSGASDDILALATSSVLSTTATWTPGSYLGIDTTNISSGTFNYATNLSGVFGLSKLGSNTLNLTGSNTFSGGLNFLGGTVNFTNAYNLGGGTALANFNGGTLYYATGNTYAFSGGNFTVGASGGTINTGSNAAVTLAATLSGAGQLTNAGGALTYSGSSTAFTGTLNLAGGTFTVASNAGITNLGTLSQNTSTAVVWNVNGALGVGTVDLSPGSGNSGSSSAVLNVHAGATMTTNTINITCYGITSGAYADYGTSSSSINVNGVLNVSNLLGWTPASGDYEDTINRYIYVPAGGQLNATTINLYGFTSGYGGDDSLVYNRKLTLSGGTLANLAGTNLTVDSSTVVSLTGTSTLAVSPTNSMTISSTNTVTGAGGLLVTGGGTVNFTAASSYSGSTTVNAGLLNFSAGTLSATAPVAFTGPGTLNVNGLSQTISSLAGVAGSQFLLGGGNLTTGGNNTNTAFAGTISGAASALVKTGSGTFTLSGSNAYTGLTAINAGTLQLGGGGTSGSIDASSGVTDNGTLAFNRSDNPTFALAVSGTGGLNTLGTGALTLSGTSTYSGPTNVSAGTLVVSGALGSTAVGIAGGATLGGNGTIGGSVTVASGAAAANQGIINLVDGAIDALAITGPGTALTLGTGSGTAVLNFDIGSGTADQLALTAGSLNLNSSVAINLTPLAGATLSAGAYNLITFSGLSGGGNFVLDPIAGLPNTLVASLNTTANAEQLILAPTTAYWTGSSGTSWSNPTNWATSAAGTGTVAVAPGSISNVYFTATGGTNLTTTLDSDFTVESLNFTASSASVTINGTNTLTIATAAGINDPAGSAAQTINANVALAAAQTWTVNSASPLTVGGVISGAGTAGLSLSGTGTVVLTAANTYAGGTTINSATLQLGNGATLNGSVTSNILNNGALVFANATAESYAGVITGTGGVTVAGSGTLTLFGGNGYSGGTTLAGGGLVLGNANALGSGGLTVAGGSLNLAGYSIAVPGLSLTGGTLSGSGQTVTVSGSGPIDAESGAVGANLTGNVALDKTTAGIVSLSGNNTYTGGTSISAGVLQLGSDTALPAGGSLSINAGTLDLGGHHPTVAAVAGSGVISNSTGAGAINISANAAAPATLGATITDGAGTTGLVKSGSGTLVVANASNNYSGGTTVSGGALQLGSATALGATSGALEVNAGTLNLAGHSTAVGALSGASGTVTSSVSGATLTAGGGNATSNFGGVIVDGVGPVALLKIGGGTLTLGGGNRYSGGTTISGGALSIANSGNLGSGNVTIAAATLQTTGSVVLDAGRTLTLSSTASAIDTPNAADHATVAGPVTGSGALNKEGAGTLALADVSGDNYSGNTNVLAGTLLATADNALSPASNLVIADGATVILDFDGSTNGFNTAGSPAGLPALAAPAMSGPALAAPALAPANIATVPEPSTLLLLAVGALAGLIVWRRRNR